VLGKNKREFAAAVVLFSIAILMMGSPVQAQCGEPGNEPCEYYNQVLYFQPDWCNYQYGDRVFVKSHTVNNEIVDYQWYVVAWDDSSQTTLAQQYNTAGWAVDWYVVSCNVYLLP
jgi:hypothetical protein